VLGGDALATPALISLLPGNASALLRGVTATTWGQGKPSFVERFKAAAPNVVYDSRAATGYDAMVALLKAYAATAPPRPSTAVAQNIVKQEFDGACAQCAAAPVRCDGWVQPVGRLPAARPPDSAVSLSCARPLPARRRVWAHPVRSLWRPGAAQRHLHHSHV
jgi:hypothetical protein